MKGNAWNTRFYEFIDPTTIPEDETVRANSCRRRLIHWPTAWSIVLSLALTSAGCTQSVDAKKPFAQTNPNAPSDSRLQPLKTLNDHFPFVVPDSADQWLLRSQQLRRRVLIATGLWPMPEKTPLEAVVFDKFDRDGFTVEKVYFQSLPGHYVTGLLFRPTPDSDNEKTLQKHPAVLSPHGHGGRNYSYSDQEIQTQIEQGAERFIDSGRTPKLARCATLARMGCVTFIFDMLGYGDSKQIAYEVAHRHAKPRKAEQESTDDEWVLFSKQAELNLHSIMGLQTWNAIRALDFLASLPDVDTDRLAVTGGSGGGTQTILLGAIDDRIKASFPNGMVSTSMQGGCYCENCSLLRIGTGNVELAALFAPKPMGMTAADDWTRDMMNDGFPELQNLYSMVGQEDDVYCRPLLNFEHNYNYVTRATMYEWFNQHLDLGIEDPIVEQDFEAFTEQEMQVWNDDHPLPGKIGADHEREVCRWFSDQKDKWLANQDDSDREEMHRVAWHSIFDLRPPKDVEYSPGDRITRNGYVIEPGMLSVPQWGGKLPTMTLLPQTDQPVRGMAVWTDPAGKSAAIQQEGTLSQRAANLLSDGFVIIVADLLGQGDFAKIGNRWTKQPLVDDNRHYSAFTFGYNRPLAVKRSGDLLAMIKHARDQAAANDAKVLLVSTGDALAWSAAAAAIAGDTVDDFQYEANRFQFSDITGYDDVNFVPGAVKYGDIDALLRLRSPHAATRID